MDSRYAGRAQSRAGFSIPARADLPDVSRIPAARAPQSAGGGTALGDRAAGRREKGRQVTADRLTGDETMYGKL